MVPLPAPPLGRPLLHPLPMANRLFMRVIGQQITVSAHPAIVTYLLPEAAL